MYSVEDLLISHGYKLAKRASSSTPTPVPSSSACQPPSSTLPSYSKHHELLENRPGPRTVNGYERGPVAALGNRGGARQPQVYGGGCPNNNNESRDGSQPKQDSVNRGQTDTHSLGESLTSDSGFCDGNRGPQLQSKDVSFWRRRGQDFTVLLDYADFREAHVKEQARYDRPEGSQQARGQELPVEAHRWAAQEKQRWAAQNQARVLVQPHVQPKSMAQGRSKEREAALHQWRMTTERKCQSLGTEDCRPAVSFGRQLSQSEGERWTQEQQRLHARTPEGMVVHPRTKAKSQSLPRMLPPESLQYVDIALSGQELYRRVNGHPFSYQNLYRAPRWPENGRPASANQLSMTPKPRFTRPPRPPSYEMHQQIRGSCEVLSGRESVTPQARDRTPLPISRIADPHLDYFAQDSGPPGYIPPPSYKRAPLMGGGCRGYGNVPADYRYRGDVYQQIQVAPDGSHWFIRHPASSWPNSHRERSVSSQKLLYPMYSTHNHPGGVQYISFDDPRIRHISSALGGNSLTDADKIRHICNELPSVTVSEPAPDDSAFLPPPLGPFISAKMAEEDNQTSSSDANKRWQHNLHKETIDYSPAPDQNCNNRHPKSQLPSPSPSSAFQALFTKTSHQGSRSDQVFAETITQVKTIVPESGAENNRNAKRRVSETIFCLVSVPVHTTSNINKDLTSDQNNNEALPTLTITKTDTFAVGLKESPNIRSKSANEMPIKSHYSHFHTSSSSSMRNYKRAPLRKEVIDAWVLQANEDKELCYAGSWPGNQYRNQETQTGSPVTGVKSPEPQSPSVRQESVQSVTITDNSIGTDSTSSYGYPMAGQKNLHPSSNSAFSRLSLSPTQAPSPQSSQQDPSSPSKVQHLRENQSSSPRKGSLPEGTEPVVFGQFLLKPVNRRPCDAIGELETINKEMEDTISKRPNLNQFIGVLDKRLAWLKLGAHLTAGPEPGREAISLPPMHAEKPNHMKKRSTSFASSADLESMEMSQAFSRPQADRMTRNKLFQNPDSRDNCLLPAVSPHMSNQLYRQDIPVPQESLLRDVGLTVYTETPGGPGKPMQRSLSVPTPLTYRDLSQSVKTLVKTGGSSEHSSNEEVDERLTIEQNRTSDMIPPCRGEANICRTGDESCILPQKEGSTITTKQKTEDVDSDERFAVSEPLTYKNDSTIADKHLERLLFKEKTNTLPAEDLSNLYEVQCAKGIPENESIEERAARILGIDVPVEALCVADRQSNLCQLDLDSVSAEKHLSSNEETLHVIGECVQVKEESLVVQGAGMEVVRETESGVDEENDNLKHSSDSSEGQSNKDTEPQAVIELPEFPPSKLPLSLPVTPDEKLALSMCGTERKGRGGACKLIESLQDKFNSSAASSAAAVSRSATDRMARLKELDSVSRIRRLSLRSPESEGEPESKERHEGTEEFEDNEKAKEDVTQQELDKDENEGGENGSKDEENPVKDVNTKVHLGDAKEPKVGIDVVCEKEQTQETQTSEAVIKANTEHRKEVEFKTQADRELTTVEDSENTLENVKDESNSGVLNRAEVTQHAEGGKVPVPHQRTRFQKPPLLPKPRSVPKREITLPPSLSTGTCSPADLDDEETLSVSDSYDPSRVERV